MADAHKNLAISEVATAPSPATSGTSLVVSSGHGTRFPAVPFNATIGPPNEDHTPDNAEIVRVTARSSDTLTITRAQEGTTARTVVVGDAIYAGFTAKSIEDVEEEILGYACSDETTPLTTGTAVLTFLMPFAMTLTSVYIELTTAPTGSAFIADLKEAGSSVFSTLPSIDVSERSSRDGATPAVLSDTSLANKAVMTVDITQIGSTVAGTGLKIYLVGKRTAS